MSEVNVNDLLISGIDLQNQGRVDEAAERFKQVLALDQQNAGAYYSLAVLYLQSGRPQEALVYSMAGILNTPNVAHLWFVHGSIFQTLGNNEDALRCYDAALTIKPDYAEVMINSGALLRSMFRHRESLERFNRVLQFQPDNTSALANCGIMLTEFKESTLAIRMFERLLALQPDYDYGLGLLFYERMHIADWTDFERLTQQIVEGVRQGQRTCKSLAFMSASDNAQDHYLATKLFADAFVPKPKIRMWQGQRYRHDKIRIAYVSPDLREHPVGHLTAGIFEHHDKSRFETIAISLGVDDNSRLRSRMLQAFDEFIDARNMSSPNIAQLMRDKEIDIAIDLGGYTSDTRTDIFAYRPAPVQVNYLGYPGTMGIDCYDYIIADKHIIPSESRAFFSEKVVYLPDTYLPTDNNVAISEQTPSRAECGLPDTGVVFCSFNHTHKISPYIFDIWMSLLNKIPDSVLWLMSRGELVQSNLRKEAVARGVAAERLIFAERVPKVEDHLARYRQADMFLDTHPYNAHTTAADALMAGLPVVTYMGQSFPSRVAGSLLLAMNLPELIAHSLQEYEQIALRLAQQPDELASLKQRVKDNKTQSALFNTADFCRNLEAIYISMWRQSQLNGTSDELGGNK